MPVTIKDIYNRPSFQKKYINVREIDLVAVEHLIEKYCDKYGDGSACISDSEPQQSGVLDEPLYSFVVSGDCVPTYENHNYQLVARKYLGDDASSSAQYDEYAEVDDDFKKAISDKAHDTSCMCCGNNRRRNDIYILRELDDNLNPTDKYCQVGSACIDKLGGSRPFAKLVKDINSKVDQSHRIIKRNEATMIEPKKFLACAMVAAKYDVQLKKGNFEGSFDFRDKTLTTRTIANRGLAFYNFITSGQRFDKFRDLYDKEFQQLDQNAEKLCKKLDSQDKYISTLGAETLYQSFDSNYPSSAAKAFVVAANSVGLCPTDDPDSKYSYDMFVLDKKFTRTHDAKGYNGYFDNSPTELYSEPVSSDLSNFESKNKKTYSGKHSSEFFIESDANTKRTNTECVKQGTDRSVKSFKAVFDYDAHGRKCIFFGLSQIRNTKLSAAQACIYLPKEFESRFVQGKEQSIACKSDTGKSYNVYGLCKGPYKANISDICDSANKYVRKHDRITTHKSREFVEARGLLSKDNNSVVFRTDKSCVYTVRLDDLKGYIYKDDTEEVFVNDDGCNVTVRLDPLETVKGVSFSRKTNIAKEEAISFGDLAAVVYNNRSRSPVALNDPKKRSGQGSSYSRSYDKSASNEIAVEY